MIIKKYRAKSLEEATKLAKQDLGPDAIILTSKHIEEKWFKRLFSSNGNTSSNDSIEVIAAIDEDEAYIKNKRITQDNLNNNLHRLQETFCFDSPDLLSSSVQNDDKGCDRLDNNANHVSSANEVLNSQKLTDHLEKYNQSKMTSSDDSERLSMMVQEEIKKIFNDDNINHSKKICLHFLQSNGVNYKIAQDIDKKLYEHFGYIDFSVREKRFLCLNTLKEELSNKIATSIPSLSAKPSTVAVVGPSGVGKSTIVAKLVKYYSKKLSKTVSVIDLYTDPLYVSTNINELTKITELSVERVSNVSECKNAISVTNSDVIIIDTKSKYSGEKGVNELVHVLKQINDVCIYLVISAYTKDIDICYFVQQLSPLCIGGIIFSKLDETLSHGVLFNVYEMTKIPISFLSYDHDVDKGFVVADKDEISKNFLIYQNVYHGEFLKG